MENINPDDVRYFVFLDVREERERQFLLSLGGNTEEFDKSNTVNDWIAYIIAYLGRAAQKVERNKREQLDTRENLVKAAALCIAAIESLDKGYMSEKE